MGGDDAFGYTGGTGRKGDDKGVVLIDLDPDLSTDTVAIIGNGNVAIDIARLLVRSQRRLGDTDIADHAREAIKNSAVTDVYMFGRRGPVEAKFTNVELREMAAGEDRLILRLSPRRILHREAVLEKLQWV